MTPRRPGATPLYIAAYNGHLPIVELLPARGVRIDARFDEEDGTTNNIISEEARCL